MGVEDCSLKARLAVQRIRAVVGSRYRTIATTRELVSSKVKAQLQWTTKARDRLRVDDGGISLSLDCRTLRGAKRKKIRIEAISKRDTGGGSSTHVHKIASDQASKRARR